MHHFNITLKKPTVVVCYYLSSAAVVVSYLNVLSHLRFNVIRTSLWKNVSLSRLSCCSSQDGKANQTRCNENDGNDKNHLQEAVFLRDIKGISALFFLLFCFVFLNWCMYVWNSSTEICLTHLRADSGTSDSIWLNWPRREPEVP